MANRPKAGWANRIVGAGEEPPDQLLANPRNWRVHPKGQQDALAGALDEVGWVTGVIVNRRSGCVVDGHLRVSLAISRGEVSVPVQYVDLGMRFLNHVCERYLRGENRYGRGGAMLFHTSHPGLCAALRRDAKWVQKSARLFGANKLRSARSLTRAARKRGGSEIGTGFGGHFRAVQGFKYVGGR